MSTPGLPITPLFYCIILFYYKNGDVCKKLELKRLRLDQDIRVLSLEKIEPKFLKKFVCGQKNAVNKRVEINYSVKLKSQAEQCSPNPTVEIYTGYF